MKTSQSVAELSNRNDSHIH